MKNSILIIFVMLLTALASGCGSEQTEQEKTKAEQDSLRRADSLALKIGVTPTEDCLPLLVAEELKLYETAGVDVHLKRCDAMSACRQMLEEGVVEGAAIDSVLMKEMNGSNAWLRSGYSTNLTWKFLTAKKARLSRLDQLADKIIAADRYGESRRLAEAAIAPLRQKKQMVFVVQVENPQIRFDMLNNGNVDAALLPEPYASKALKLGAKAIGDVKSKSVGVIAVRIKALEDARRKKQLDAFVKALNIANDSIKTYGKESYSHCLDWQNEE